MKLKLNSRLQAALKWSIKMGKGFLKELGSWVVTLATLSALALVCLKLPELHNKFLRSKVGDKVYMIRDSEKSGGGTGFAIKAPSGATYILTNDHVCEVSSDNKTVLVTHDNISMRRNIVAHDAYSDLCLVEGLPGVEGLTMARFAPLNGDTLNVVGHPRLMPRHVSSGEMTGTEEVKILLGFIAMIDPQTGEELEIDPELGGLSAKQCSLPKHRMEYANINAIFFTLRMKVCMMVINDAYVTGVTVHPGNSGSPVVSFWGNVQGVVFASDSSTNWGRMIPLEQVNAFLKNY